MGAKVYQAIAVCGVAEDAGFRRDIPKPGCPILGEGC